MFSNGTDIHHLTNDVTDVHESLSPSLYLASTAGQARGRRSGEKTRRRWRSRREGEELYHHHLPIPFQVFPLIQGPMAWTGWKTTFTLCFFFSLGRRSRPHAWALLKRRGKQCQAGEQAVNILDLFSFFFLFLFYDKRPRIRLISQLFGTLSYSRSWLERRAMITFAAMAVRLWGWVAWKWRKNLRFWL